MEYVNLKKIKEELGLEIINKASDFEDVKIYLNAISRSGLQLAGYFEKFVSERV